MDLPQSIWNHELADGKFLSDCVQGVEPTALPLDDITGFRNVWKERLADGVARGVPDLVGKSQNVLNFLATHDAPLILLLWPDQKLAALLELASGNFIFVD